MTTDFQKLLEVFVEPLQALEDMFFQLLDMLDIDGTSGVGLDLIGVLVGCGRQGDLDSRYRIRLRAQILVNKSEGTPQEIVDIVRLLIDDGALAIVVTVGNDAEFQLQITDGFIPTAVGRQVETAIEQAKGFGIRSLVIWQDTEEYFGFDEDTNPNRLGFDDGPFVFQG